jgi:hypothetical protein
VYFVIVLLAVWYIRERNKYDGVKTIGGQTLVLREFHNRAQAAAIISTVNVKMINFMRFLKKKYFIDVSDDQVAANEKLIQRLKKHPGDLYNMVDSLLNNYNVDTLYENDPRNAGETSYTVDKGRKMYICVREKADVNKFVSPVTLEFVVLHECAHIANYAGFGHTTQFWEIFRWLLHEAKLAGIHNPIDYELHPVDYTGMTIAYSPYYDKKLRNIW